VTLDNVVKFSTTWRSACGLSATATAELLVMWWNGCTQHG